MLQWGESLDDSYYRVPGICHETFYKNGKGAMRSIVDSRGEVRLGLFEAPIDEINFKDYCLKTTSGKNFPGALKRFRYKSFHFVGIATGGILAGVAIADIGYLANCFVYVYDFESCRFFEEQKLIPGWGKATIRQTPEKPLSRFNRAGLNVRIQDSSLNVSGKQVRMDLTLDNRTVPPPVRVCTRTGYRGWTFTRKSAPVPIRGTIHTPSGIHSIERNEGVAITDWTGGFLRRETWWNWAAIACNLPGGQSLGLNLSWGTNETGYSENAFWLDSEKTSAGTVWFRSESHEGKEMWRIGSSCGAVDLKFIPEYNRSDSVNTLLVVSSFVQYFGRFSGTLITEGGRKVSFRNIPGWMEDHVAVW